MQQPPPAAFANTTRIGIGTASKTQKSTDLARCTAVGCNGFWAAGMPEAPALLGLLADEPFIDVDQLDELLTIAAMIGMILLGQGPKALFDLREPRVRWQPQQRQ